MTRVDNPAPATFDLGQIKTLAQTRFGAALMDCNLVTADDGSTLVAVYLPAPAAATVTAWASDLAAYTVTHPTAAEQAANLATLIGKAQNALTSNATFQAIASPTNAQNAAQVQALTKQCNGIIRLLLNSVDSTTGT